MLTRVRYVGARLYVLARVPTWYQKKKAASLI